MAKLTLQQYYQEQTAFLESLAAKGNAEVKRAANIELVVLAREAATHGIKIETAPAVRKPNATPPARKPASTSPAAAARRGARSK